MSAGSVSQRDYENALKWFTRVQTQLDILQGQLLQQQHAIASFLAVNVWSAFSGDRNEAFLEDLKSLEETQRKIGSIASLGAQYERIVNAYQAERRAMELAERRAWSERASRVRRVSKLRAGITRRAVRLQSEPENVEMPAPVVEVPSIPASQSHVLTDGT